jgi:pimeloyl-ACP methyl ester carboxylesterase
LSNTKNSFDIYSVRHRLSAQFIRPKAGADNRPVLVFLHEGLGSIGQWRDFPEKLCEATGCAALVYDRWGHGGSDPLTESRTPGYLHHEALLSLPEVLSQCAIDKPIFIGHSDGGSIAIIYAGTYPQKVAGIITMAAHVFVEDVTVEGIRRARAIYESTDLNTRLAKFHGSNTELMFRGWADIWLSPAFRDWNIENYLPNLTCPLLALQGRDDEYGTPAQVEAIVGKAAGPARGSMIANCGHIPHIQAREKVFAEMVNFISTIIEEAVKAS